MRGQNQSGISLKSKQVITRVGVTAAVLLSLTACIQSMEMKVQTFADTSSLRVSDDTLKTVNRVLYSDFKYGDWRYKGAHARAGQINVYIQVPQPLDMHESVQERYVKEVLCPKHDNHDLWHQLKNIDLSIHLYTRSKNDSVSAVCERPASRTV